MNFVRLAILAVSFAVGFVASAQTHAKTGPRADIAAGKELYHQHCSVCHGVDGKGTPARVGGIYDPQSIEPERRVRPADLTTLSEKNGGTFPAERVRNAIFNKDSVRAHGTPEMPAWGNVFYLLKDRPKLLEKRVRDLTAYIESIQATEKR
jgi:mono/diheme cytochrome c family protein